MYKVTLIVLLAAVAAPLHSVRAAQVDLDLAMSQPALLSDQKHTTYLRVGLTGFKMEDRRERTPVNVALVLDKSGSMSGEKIARARDAACMAIRRLDRHDIVSVVTYDSTVEVLVPATKLTDKDAICQKIRQIGPGGSTALFAGVSKGAGEVRKFLSDLRVNRIILLSDGLANVGPKTPGELGDLGASLIKEGVSVSTMGLGLGYNEDLMTELARRSDGNHVFIEDADELATIFNHEFDDVLSVVAQEVGVTIRVADGIRPVRVLGMDAEIAGQRVVVQLNQLYGGQEKYVLLELEVPAKAPGQSVKVADVDVSYANMATESTDRLESGIRVEFTGDSQVVERRTNKEIMADVVLQLANYQNVFATKLRDQGDVEAARRVLEENAQFLERNALRYNAPALQQRSKTNMGQAQRLEGPEWNRTRKMMRQEQYRDATQQAY